jgi:hypothetical protein
MFAGFWNQCSVLGGAQTMITYNGFQLYKPNNRLIYLPSVMNSGDTVVLYVNLQDCKIPSYPIVTSINIYNSPEDYVVLGSTITRDKMLKFEIPLKKLQSGFIQLNFQGIGVSSQFLTQIQLINNQQLSNLYSSRGQCNPN